MKLVRVAPWYLLIGWVWIDGADDADADGVAEEEEEEEEGVGVQAVTMATGWADQRILLPFVSHTSEEVCRRRNVPERHPASLLEADSRRPHTPALVPSTSGTAPRAIPALTSCQSYTHVLQRGILHLWRYAG